MIEGFLELVTPGEMRGWAFDPARPETHLLVEVLSGARVLGSVQADMYRRDLETAGQGEGDHAFLLTLTPPLSATELEHVSARASHPGARPQPLRRLTTVSEAPPERPPIAWHGRTSDSEHRPVFILGAARSGTSAVAHALLAATRYEGNEEGHLFDVLAPLTVALNGFYASKTDERAPGRNTTTARVPKAFFEDAFAEMTITAARALFPSGLWLDKTPSANMIHLAPLFRRIWPKARFIFMKRRAIENIASRLRKFDYDFAHNCREWAQVMQAWLTVREPLDGVALELDQLTAAREPAEAATAIARLLDLSSIEERRVAQMLAHERPQRTGETFGEAKSLEEMGWRPDWVRTFRELCGPMMAAYDYRE